MLIEVGGGFAFMQISHPVLFGADTLASGVGFYVRTSNAPFVSGGKLHTCSYRSKVNCLIHQDCSLGES